MDGGTEGRMLAFCSARSHSHSACRSSGISIGRPRPFVFFCPPKVQIHVEELLLLFFILAAQIQTSVRVCLSDRRRGPNDDGDDEARRSPRARGSSPCAKCAAVILSRSRMPKRGFLLRNRHPGHRVKTILWPRPAAGVATTLGGGIVGAVKLIHPPLCHDLMVSGL